MTMVETDWREILSFSQRELTLSEKEKLCESLCWMEADDIELNFTDLKTLFRLSQDILKLKSEQVNNLFGQIESTQRKSGKTKVKSQYTESPTQSNDSALETITHQEEIIKANKEILEQLSLNIAELEGRKSRLEESRSNLDIDSDSSRDVLSEMNAVAELEQEINLKNKHIRKLLSDVKILEEENSKLKEKVSNLKDKLTEATQLINNLTEQLLDMNNECTRLKDILGKSQHEKNQLSIEVGELKKEKFNNEYGKENIYDEIKSKVQHWKNIAKSKKAEVEALSHENRRLKENLVDAEKLKSSPQVNEIEKSTIKELQDKLIEASNKIEQSANVINVLRNEIKELNAIIDEKHDTPIFREKVKTDDSDHQVALRRLKSDVKCLTENLQKAEEILSTREKELAETTSQLQLLRSDEGINSLLEGLKHKKRQLKLKDEGVKSLVHEVNTLNQLIDELQLQNETLRLRFNLPPEEKILSTGILKHYQELQETNVNLNRELKKLENTIISLELNNRHMSSKNRKMEDLLYNLGYSKENIDTDQATNNQNGEPSRRSSEDVLVNNNLTTGNTGNINVQALIEENKGLRNGLQEILNLLKDNSKTSSGILTLQCPSLEAILMSMEARNSAGWFAPHMTTILELRAALGGKDALLSALHEARKEIYEVMTQLSQETKKSTELEQKLHDVESFNKKKEAEEKLLHEMQDASVEFGSWMQEKEQNDIDINDGNQIEKYVQKGYNLYEMQLKKGLKYFHKKFKTLFDQMTSMTIQATDNSNTWSIQEEQYKAEIENLRSQLKQTEEADKSDDSPGLVPIPSITFLKRKCSYLEEMYKYIRTLNENMKNEILENKKEKMLLTSDFEIQIQKLILSVTNLTDKLRCSIPLDMFWKQNSVHNELILKYRSLLDKEVLEKNKHVLKQTEQTEQNLITNHTAQEKVTTSATTCSPENWTVMQAKVDNMCNEIENKNKIIETLREENLELQKVQAKIIDNNLSSTTKQEVDLIRGQINNLVSENQILNEQCSHVGSQLDIALMQLQDSQQRQMSCDIEVNMLRHQILDLQSVGDNKAIIARLSGEILVAHLQASESHKKIERLKVALNKEKELRADAEEMLRVREKIFEVYTTRYESKFRYMYEVMQILRKQYQGALPFISIENYLNNMEDLYRNNYAVNEKLTELEELRSNLIAKHSIFDQILDISKNKCLEGEGNCSHRLKYIMMQSVNTREFEHLKKKINTLEQSREELIKHCNNLEKALVLVNQGFGNDDPTKHFEKKTNNGEESHLELEDLPSDDESDSRRSQTVTLTKPQILKPKCDGHFDKITKSTVDTASSPIKINRTKESMFIDKSAQTIATEILKRDDFTQTSLTQELEKKMLCDIENFKKGYETKDKELILEKALSFQQTEKIQKLIKEKQSYIPQIQILKESIMQKDGLNERLRSTIDGMQKQLDDFKITHATATNRIKESVNEENKCLLLSLKQLETDKHAITTEYKQLLANEREEYSKSVKDLHVKIAELQSKLDRRGSESSATSGEALKEVITKYTMKIAEFEDKCFKLQSELDECKAGLTTYRSEAERWKELASERLIKMEQLNLQLEERHCQEVDSYKAENQHWLSKLNNMQREHIDLRTRLTDQKTIYVKQLGDKDTQIEQLRTVINNLKTQIMNMHTLISVNDPSFDLSAIVEVDEATDVLSQSSDRLEIKFESSIDLHDVQDDVVRFPASSTSIWQEPIIERLRREKQLAAKQNVILRRQIKVLASRERRARLDAQNLKNQVFRISTTGSKVATAETAALQNKVAKLQAQLTSAQRDTHSSVALWDKWKRAQQTADRWQARYEEKYQDVTKLEGSLNMAKSALSRLEKEKRVLLSRLAEIKSEGQLSAIEKQDRESPEKSQSAIKNCECSSALPVSTQALLDRVEAQQRRIAALEVAEKGNEFLVSEYEKSLAEITSLKGQVLKLESTLLESQIRTPGKSTNDTQPELDYWKSYCQMLKEENVQLTQKINSLETVPTTAHQHRVNDLEQTVLTLRGLVSKLQAEQKQGGSHKKIDSRPSSGRSVSEKGRNQLDTYRIEIANLKRSLNDKDLLLERSKEMLKIAAEREDDLLRENTYLHRQMEELTRSKSGFLSA